MGKWVYCRERKRISISLCCFWLLVVGGLCILTNGIPHAYAQSDKDSLEDICAAICGGDPECPARSSPMEELCNDLFANVNPSVTLNRGMIGAQGRTSNLLAEQQRKGAEKRLAKIKKEREEDKKRKRTTDGGESIEILLGKWGFFLSALYTDTDRDKTSKENGFDSELGGLMLGVDYRFSDKLIAGVAAGYSDEDADFNSDAGHLDTESVNVTLYGSFMPVKNFYADGYLGYGSLDYVSERNFSISSAVLIPPQRESTRATFDGDQYLAGFNAGYDWHYGPFAMGPQIKLDYSQTEIESYSEKGSLLGLRVDDQTIRSLESKVGVQTSYAQRIPWGGVLVPQARAYWVHQYKDESRDIPSSLGGAPSNTITTGSENPDRNYLVWGAGLSAVMPHGILLFADFEQTFSHEFLHIWTATAGFRMQF